MYIYSYCLVLNQIVLTYASITLPFKCPPAVLWKRIAASFPCGEDLRYHCLLDAFSSNGTYNVYIEKCYRPHNYIGKRHVISGYLTADECQSTRFSPFILPSNEGSECPFYKSLCTEDGQLTVFNGSSREDQACRCDYRKSYDYVIKPQNQCRCQPFTEDCSCYIRNCPIGQFLSQDYKCRIHGEEIEPVCGTLFLTNESVYERKNSIEDISKTDSIAFGDKNPLLVIVCCSGCLILLAYTILCIHDKLTTPQTPLQESTPSDTNKTKKDFNVIYISSDINVSEWYQNTEELEQIKKAMNGESRLVIARGISGSGKTETVNKFCSEVTESYSIIAKVALSRSLRFVEILECLANKINIYTTQEEIKSVSSIINNLQKYLNVDKRRGYPYLFVVDNIDKDTVQDYNDIWSFVSLIDKVPNLNIILSTKDQTLEVYFKGRKHKIVHFKGMREKEYRSLFQAANYSKVDDVDALVKVIGTIPLVLITAIRYMASTAKTPKRYLEEYCSERLAMFEAMDIFTEDSKTVLQSQVVPLNYVKKKLLKEGLQKAWEVFRLIPFLRFRNVSTTVLQALYYHLTKCLWNEKKKIMDYLESILKSFSLCSTKSTQIPCIEFPSEKSCPSQHNVSSQNDVSSLDQNDESTKCYEELEFHEVTMYALEIFKQKEKETNKTNELKFLLGMFCYEIDIDARTDTTVYRNMQFVSHAEKVLEVVKKMDCDSIEKEEHDELKFYIAYLHCAIGSTYLFERTYPEKAHLHLMKARSVALSIVNDTSQFTKDACPFLANNKGTKKKLGLDTDMIEKVSEKILKYSFRDKFVECFVFGKRRNQNEIDVIEKEMIGENEDLIGNNLQLYKSYYLSKEDYSSLCTNKLALSLEKISGLILSELILRITHNNGRALNELKYIIHDRKTSGSTIGQLKEACRIDFTTASKFCAILENHLKEQLRLDSIDLFSCLESKRSGRMLMRWNQQKIELHEIDSDIEYFEKLIESPTKRCFDFGVLNMTESLNTRHKASCQRILLRYLVRKYKQSPTAKRQAIYDHGKKKMSFLQDLLQVMKDGSLKYRWLSMPSTVIKCGKFLLLSGSRSDTENALSMFEKALKFEESRKAFWTRYTFQGYKGKVRCLLKLEQNQEARQIVNEVTSKLMGLNRDNVREKLERIIENETEQKKIN